MCKRCFICSNKLTSKYVWTFAFALLREKKFQSYFYGIVHKGRHILRGEWSRIMCRQVIKKCDDGRGHIKNCPKLRDVIYGRPFSYFCLNYFIVTLSTINLIWRKKKTLSLTKKIFFYNWQKSSLALKLWCNFNLGLHSWASKGGSCPSPPWPAKNILFLDFFEKNCIFCDIFRQKVGYCFPPPPSPWKIFALPLKKLCRSPWSHS